MERTIRVTGTGKVSIKPDITIINMTFSDVLPTYEEALKASTNDVKIVKDALEKAGLKRESLKTTQFNINAHYESFRDEKNNYKSVFDGYEYTQTLRFKFPVDNKLLGKVLYQLSQISVNPKFNIYYGVEDPEAAKNELLGNAILDAKKKAEIISKSANIKLGDIKDINYSWIDVEFRTRSYDMYDNCEMMMCKCAADGFDVDIEPEDIDKTDNITITFSIE